MNLSNVCNVFQFQLGAIGSVNLSILISRKGKFQFQLGAIGSKVRRRSEIQNKSFNSSLVRLGATGTKPNNTS